MNQDIVLDMHLDLTVPVTVDPPLTFPGLLGPARQQRSTPGSTSARRASSPTRTTGRTGPRPPASVSSAGRCSFPNFPRLDGSNFVFLNECAGTQFYPVSYYFRRQPGDLSLRGDHRADAARAA